MDVVLLSRIQFALTIMFHYLFPPLTIGLGLIMVLTEGQFLRSGDRRYEALARFWTKIYAVTFAVGVASGSSALFVALAMAVTMLVTPGPPMPKRFLNA